MAWKNGGGVTHEVITNPEGAPLDAFDWRVSMAEVNAPGPFSLFPGCDRILSILEGGPMHLSTEGCVVALSAQSEPFAFAADQPASAKTLDAEVLDLNVMTRRGEAQASIVVHRTGLLDLPHSTATRLVVVFGGSAQVADQILFKRDVLVVSNEYAQISPAEGTRLYLIEIRDRTLEGAEA